MTIRVKQFNHLNEDPTCERPYPEGSNSPSYIAENAECVKIGEKEWIKLYIEQTTENFQDSGLDWDIPDYFNPKSKEEFYA